MSTSLKIIGGALVLAGGVYVLCRTKLLKKIGGKVTEAGSAIKESFEEGYAKAVDAG